MQNHVPLRSPHLHGVPFSTLIYIAILYWDKILFLFLAKLIKVEENPCSVSPGPLHGMYFSTKHARFTVPHQQQEQVLVGTCISDCNELHSPDKVWKRI